MAKFARLLDNVVIETINLDAELKIEDVYHPLIAATFVACAENVEVGWNCSGGKFLPPIESDPEPPTTSQLISYAASKRYAVETGGIVLNEMRVMTDRASQSLITGAYNYVRANPDVTVKFKTAAGFVELTATQLTAIANAVGAHVQAAFATEANLSAEISSGSVKSFADIDIASWPSNI